MPPVFDFEAIDIIIWKPEIIPIIMIAFNFLTQHGTTMWKPDFNTDIKGTFLHKKYSGSKPKKLVES